MAALARGFPTAHRGPNRGSSMAGRLSNPAGLRRPSNDNFKPPANDNVPKQLNKAFRKATARAAFRSFGKFVPYLGAALTAYEIYQYFKAQTETEFDPAANGWVLKLRCGPAVFGPYARNTSYCGSLESVQKSSLYTKTCTYSYCHIGYHDNSISPSGSYYRGRIAEVWRYDRRAPGADPNPVVAPGTSPGWTWPQFAPDYDPWPHMPYDPLRPPQTEPLPYPQPLPRRAVPQRKPNPFRNPREQTQRGPNPTRQPRGRVDFTPYPGTRISVRPQTRFKRPPPGTKERKVALKLPKVLNRWYGRFTEGIDFIDVIYDSLPMKYQDFDANPYQKARTIYDHYDEIDIERAVMGLVQEQIEDRVWGAIGNRMKQVAREHRMARTPTISRFGTHGMGYSP